MNVNTYSDLQDTIASYLARSDLTDQIPVFIKFAEIRLRRELRMRQMLTSTTISTTASDNTVSIPSDFLQARDFYVTGNPNQSMEYVAPNVMSRSERSTYVGKPTLYTILGSEFQIAPVPDTVYTLKLLYYAAPDFLSDSNTTNEFLTNVPEILLYASLIEAEPYLMNDPRITTWISMYEKAVNQITTSETQGQYSGVPLAIKVS